MKQEDIDKAFENRWRYKEDSILTTTFEAIDGKLSIKELSVMIASFCRDFFETGIIVGEGFCIAYEHNETGGFTGQEILYKHDPIFDTADGGFSEWWEMYGKKVDRKKCIKKWNNLTCNEKQLCLIATPAYVASTPDVAYRKNPLTYLNGECWNDEIIMKNGNKSTTDQRSKLGEILAP